MQPPDSNEGFPNYNDPLPPGPGGSPSPYGGGYPPNNQPVLKFDYIPEAWNIIQPQLGTYIGAMVLAGLAIAVFYVPMMLLQVQLGQQQNTTPSIGASLGVMFLSLLSVVVSMMVSAGLFRMAINHIRTGKAEIMDIFTTYDVALSLIVLAIVQIIAFYCGICLCVLPGYIIMSLAMFSIPLVVDQKLGPIEAFSKSVEVLRPHMWMALGFYIVVSIVASLGIIACGVGIFVSAPVALMTITIAYRNFFLTNDGLGSNSGYGVPPIADPNY